MGWLTALTNQVSELWQQLLYAVELTTAGSDDEPWLDTLDFFWDSLPDGDKLTTAERRRLAYAVKLMVRQNVRDYYNHALSTKAAIAMRQSKQEALAQQHLQELAEKRQREMQGLSETARVQGLFPPAESAVHLRLLWEKQQQQRLQQQHQHQQRQQQRTGNQQQPLNRPRQQQQEQEVVRQQMQPATAVGVPGRHIVIRIPESTGEIVPGWDDASTVKVCPGLSGQLQEPLLSPADSPSAAAQQPQQRWLSVPDYGQHGQYQPPGIEGSEQQQQQQEQQQAYQQPAAPSSSTFSSSAATRGTSASRSSSALSSNAMPPSTPCPQQTTSQLGERGIRCDVSSLNHSASQMLLQRYLDASLPAGIVDAAAVAAAAAAAAAPRHCECGTPAAVLQTVISSSFGQTVSEAASEGSLAAASSAADQQEQHCSSCCCLYSRGTVACGCQQWRAAGQEGAGEAAVVGWGV